MVTVRTCLSFSLALTSLGLLGCQQPPIETELVNMSTDANSNGFPDVTPPVGVVFEEARNIKVRISNSITLDDIKPFAQAQGVSPALLDNTEVAADVALTLGYGQDATTVIRDTFQAKPFEKAFEVACPETVMVEIDILATLPVVGLIPVANIPVDLTQDLADFDCGQTIEVDTFLNDRGQPDLTTDIS